MRWGGLAHPPFAVSDSHRRNAPPRPASRSRQITRQLVLEFGEVTRDHGQVEAPEDRLLRLSVEQETERRLHTALRRVLAAGQPLEGRLRHRDVVARLALPFGDHYLEFEGLARADAPNLDHVDLRGRFARRLVYGNPAGEESARSKTADAILRATHWPRRRGRAQCGRCSSAGARETVLRPRLNASSTGASSATASSGLVASSTTRSAKQPTCNP